jgi:hypothetical protein
MAFPTSGLVAYWKLDGNSNDSVGSLNGTDTSVTYGLSYGIINQGAQLLRSFTSRILFGTSASLQPGSAMSMSMWINIASAPASFCAIGGNNVYGQARGYLFDMDTTNLAFQVGDGAWGKVTTTYTTGAWIHLVGTWDGSTVTFYKNGSSAGTALKGAITYTSCGMTVGNYYTDATSANMFDGSVDEIGVWNRALTSGEVTTLYNGGSGLSYSTGYTMTAAVGAFVLTGIAANFLYGRVMSAAVGSFALTGIAATLARGFGILASAGSFVLTGIAATLRTKAWTFRSKSATTFSETGKSATTFTTANKSSSTWTFRSKN